MQQVASDLLQGENSATSNKQNVQRISSNEWILMALAGEAVAQMCSVKKVFLEISQN